MEDQLMNIVSFPCRRGCNVMLTPEGPAGQAENDAAQASHDVWCLALFPGVGMLDRFDGPFPPLAPPEYQPGYQPLTGDGFVHPAGSPEAAQAPFANPPRPIPPAPPGTFDAPPAALEAAAHFFGRGWVKAIHEIFGQTANVSPPLYADKCDECTTGVSCEEAGRCLFEG
jgi:hypothetical protein